MFGTTFRDLRSQSTACQDLQYIIRNTIFLSVLFYFQMSKNGLQVQILKVRVLKVMDFLEKVMPKQMDRI